MSNKGHREIIGAEFKKQSGIHSSIKTVSAIRDFKTRNKFTFLTVDIMEEASFSGKADKDKLDAWEDIASFYGIPISSSYHLVDFGGYSIYALRGLKSITGYKSDEGFGVSLAVDLSKFSRKSSDLSLKLRGNVLDFGCSVGWVSNLLRKRFNSNSYGADIDEKAVSLGRFFEAGNLYASFKINGHYAMPIPDGRFDLVLSKAALFEAPSNGLASFAGEKTREFRKTMDDVSRVMKKDGMLLVETNLKLESIFPLLDSYLFVYIDTFHSGFSDKEWKLFQKYG